MGSTESGEEIIERVVVGQIDNGELSAPLVFISVQQVIVSDGEVEQIALLNARRLVIVVFSACCRDADQARSILRSRAQIRTER